MRCPGVSERYHRPAPRRSLIARRVGITFLVSVRFVNRLAAERQRISERRVNPTRRFATLPLRIVVACGSPSTLSSSLKGRTRLPPLELYFPKFEDVFCFLAWKVRECAVVEHPPELFLACRYGLRDAR